jgi:hypothetical protein
MQIARLLAKKFALTAGVAGPLLTGIAVVSVNVATVPAATVIAPTSTVAMFHNSAPGMFHN